MADINSDVQAAPINYDLCVSSMVNTAEALDTKRKRIGLFIQGLNNIVPKLLVDPDLWGSFVMDHVCIGGSPYSISVAFRVPILRVYNGEPGPETIFWIDGDASLIPDDLVTPLYRTLPEIVKRLDEAYPKNFMEKYRNYTGLV